MYLSHKYKIQVIFIKATKREINIFLNLFFIQKVKDKEAFINNLNSYLGTYYTFFSFFSFDIYSYLRTNSFRIFNLKHNIREVRFVVIHTKSIFLKNRDSIITLTITFLRCFNFWPRQPLNPHIQWTIRPSNRIRKNARSQSSQIYYRTRF